MGTSRTSSVNRGCYGYRVTSLQGADDLMVPIPVEWPMVNISCRSPVDVQTGVASDMDVIGPAHAVLPLQGGGEVTIDRAQRQITFELARRPPDGDLAHPYLAPAAAVMARWDGRESFHAAAVLSGGGVWGFLGDKESGKSSTVGRLALEGWDVLVDDLLILDGTSAFAGPRCIDLRESSAARLGVGESIGVVGARERFRMPLGPVPASAPLRGWVVLKWGEEVALEPLSGPERLLTLLQHRAVRLAPEDPTALLELSSCPVWRLSRPRCWDVLDRVVALLRDELAR